MTRRCEARVTYVEECGLYSVREVNDRWDGRYLATAINKARVCPNSLAYPLDPYLGGGVIHFVADVEGTI